MADPYQRHQMALLKVSDNVYQLVYNKILQKRVRNGCVGQSNSSAMPNCNTD